MGLSYPIASNARSALLLQDGDFFAANIIEAKEQAGGPVALVSEWLKPTPDELSALQAAAETQSSYGFVQSYADNEGETVFAVSYWKTQSPADLEKAQEDEDRLRAQYAREHTNDTYFTRPEQRRKRFPKRAKRLLDIHPDQMDLFRDDDA